MRTDVEIQQDVLAQLRGEPALNASKIDVSVSHGVVTLTGEVDSYYKKMAGMEAIKVISGVRAIADDVHVGSYGGDSRTDTEIAEAAATALSMHQDIDERKIRIAVDEGMVTLEGSVTWNFQRRAAAELIKGLKGIRGINNYIRVRPDVPSEGIRERIRESLRRNVRLNADRIIVEVTGGKVVIRGAVSSLSEGEDVEHAAWSAPGVVEVDNKLVIEEEGDGN
ncbi:MAG TPA: BON domain-containing protein [Puia sp.]|uniref:BON domain-containing protein n=1 Tax=Puia sp. TaxID=2045100 RepID=UPI002CD016E4|nr:BON domain-containing protein [Puia sp.]HVU94157.1 BON domain-containing protein [Puia sp.]